MKAVLLVCSLFFSMSASASPFVDEDKRIDLTIQRFLTEANNTGSEIFEALQQVRKREATPNCPEACVLPLQVRRSDLQIVVQSVFADTRSSGAEELNVNIYVRADWVHKNGKVFGKRSMRFLCMLTNTKYGSSDVEITCWPDKP